MGRVQQARSMESPVARYVSNNRKGGVSLLPEGFHCPCGGFGWGIVI
jgi:hypothetical protein